MFLWTWCQYLLCKVTAQVAASNIIAVDVITCKIVRALHTVASFLPVLPASDRTLRRQKVSQPDAARTAMLVMLSADARLTPATTHNV